MLKTICLVMIVRNEATVIRRCLDSVKQIINHWVICDTGSSDGTLDIIRETLKDIPGNLHETPWVDFGHNRTQALKFAKGNADYYLLIDADMTVTVRGEFRDKLTADTYLIRFDGPVGYWVERLVTDQRDWKYVGVTHEFLYLDSDTTREKLPELSITHFEDGAARTDKYLRDIQMLKKASSAESVG